MKTVKFSDFFAKNEQKSQKNSDFSQKNAKNMQKSVKNREKLIKSHLIRMAIIISFLVVFGADIVRIVIALISLAISGLVSLINVH